MPALPRATIVDAATRVIQRRGHRGLLWSQVAREAGTRSLVLQRRFEDIDQLVYECHDRSAAALEASLLRGETAAGAGRARLRAFLGAAFALRRERGAFLTLGRSPGLASTDAKRLREREQMVRTRLERLLAVGERDGSLRVPEREAAVELLLAALHQPGTDRASPRRVQLDAALAELLLAALSPAG